MLKIEMNVVWHSTRFQKSLLFFCHQMGLWEGVYLRGAFKIPDRKVWNSVTKDIGN